MLVEYIAENCKKSPKMWSKQTEMAETSPKKPFAHVKALHWGKFRRYTNFFKTLENN